MRRLLLQLDSSPHPSVFDRIVALDAGADDVLSYGRVEEAAVQELVHGAIFTRGPKDLRQTAIFVGGTSVAEAERLFRAVCASFFGPFRVSVLFDASGSNTTAVAAVTKLREAAGEVSGRRVIITSGTGAVGICAAGLLAKAGAEVTLTSRDARHGAETAERIAHRVGSSVRSVAMSDSSQAAAVLEGAELLLNAGRAGVRMIPREAWVGRAGLRAVADLNAVPPLGIEGVEASDDGVQRDGIITYGALGVGKLKMKIHKACIAQLFERNDLVLDAEAIARLAGELAASRT